MTQNFERDPIREPIKDFVELIKREKENGVTPSKHVLNFRDWQKNNHEETVYKIKTDFLRFRKDNGRISSDVETYERLEAPLEEEKPESQKKISEFLWNKNPERIQQLMSLLKHSGQLEPAIITCDGFLVNGNRRKLALEKLFEEEKDPKYSWMKVVILPENTTIREIEEVENRYQYHSDGKEEYTHFDKALSIRRKEKAGMTLEMQLLDDPEYANLSKKQRENQLKKMKTEYLGTLKCIDEYLEYLEREGMYQSVVERTGDKSGRWEAFMTFNKNVFSKLNDPKERAALNIKGNETGKVIDAAFKIIRKRDLKTGRLNDIMRKFPKMLNNNYAKKEILKIANQDMVLSNDDIIRDGKKLPPQEQDKVWGGKYGPEIINSVQKAKSIVDFKTEQEKPLEMLEAALKKILHNDLDLENISPHEIHKAIKITDEIIDEAKSIRVDLDHRRYKLQKFESGAWK